MAETIVITTTARSTNNILDSISAVCSMGRKRLSSTAQQRYYRQQTFQQAGTEVATAMSEHCCWKSQVLPNSCGQCSVGRKRACCIVEQAAQSTPSHCVSANPQAGLMNTYEQLPFLSHGTRRNRQQGRVGRETRDNFLVSSRCIIKDSLPESL